MTIALASDPVVDLVLRGALAVLFASAAVHKLRDVAAFREIVRAYRLVPDAAIAAAPAIAVGELAVAALVMLPSARSSAPLAAASLLTLYSTVIAVNLARGRRSIDCGCGPLGARQPISEWLVARNAVLVVAALLTLRTPVPRALVWVDGLTIAGAVAVLAAAWSAAHTLWGTSGLWATRILWGTSGLWGTHVAAGVPDSATVRR
jgi:hypothetical protein